MISSSLAPAHPHIKAGTLKGLAILGDKRWHDLPDVPTSKEAGYDDFNFDTPVGLMATAKTPPEIVQRLNVEVNKALSDATLRAQYQKQNFVTRGGSADEFAKVIAADHARFSKLIREVGIKPDLGGK